MKHFYPNESAFFRDVKVSIHRAQGLTERLDEYENEANHVLWPSQWPDPNPTEHL